MTLRGWCKVPGRVIPGGWRGSGGRWADPPSSLPRWALEECALQEAAALHLRDMRGSAPLGAPRSPLGLFPQQGL